MAHERLSLIALRVLDKQSTGKKRLEVGKFYYFSKGAYIEEGKIKVCASLYTELEKGTIYDEYLSADGGLDVPTVTITSIVGQNGAGKSSIVEMVMRLINNFATSVFGENPPANKAVERLRYIDGIYAELYYFLDGKFYNLCVQNRNVRIDCYECVNESFEDKDVYYQLCLTPYYDNAQSIEKVDRYNKMPAYPSRSLRFKEHIETLQGFFYTLVHNYSIHAYNTNDFKAECCSVEYERMVQERKTGFVYPDERCWLRGLFHKNDGYQRPMVITPFRSRGSIDVETENSLLLDRLIGLLLSTHSFRTINGHLKVKGIVITKNGKSYGIDYLKGKKSGQFTKYYPLLNKNGYDNLKSLIVKEWSDNIGYDLFSFAEQRKYYDIAIEYLVCKSLKVAGQYSQYSNFYSKHAKIKSKVDKGLLQKYVNALSADHSHITKKIRQTLAYIVFGTYETKEWDGIETDVNKAELAALRLLTDNRKKHDFIREPDEIAPPPFFDVSIKLLDAITHEDVDFNTLSSGEKQQVFTISSILYHLQNLRSVFKDSNRQRVAYSHACVILEEIELYYHPELQQEFMKYLLDGIRQVRLGDVKALCFLIVTHSPFVLSDIPSDKILSLSKDYNTEEEVVRSFAANIHEMLKTGFFLPTGSVGLVARWMITRISICLRLHDVFQNGSNEMVNNRLEVPPDFLDKMLVDKQKLGFLNSYIENVGEKVLFNVAKFVQDFSRDYIHSHIMIIDEPIVREALTREFHRVFHEYRKDEEITELKKRLSELVNEKKV